jgi:hypothetical protein
MLREIQKWAHLSEQLFELSVGRGLALLHGLGVLIAEVVSPQHGVLQPQLAVGALEHLRLERPVGAAQRGGGD